MPRQVDHEARRQRIADAVCRLAARRGVGEVSLRQVAAEAGVSMGQVQHYFRTKDDMLLFAFHTVSARVEQRLGTAFPDASTPPTAYELLRLLLLAMLPIDEPTRFEAPLWLAFLAQAVISPNLAEPFRAGTVALVGFAADQLRSAQQQGDVEVSLHPEREAISLFALADGLMIRTLLDPHFGQQAIDTIDYHLDRLFTPSGRSRGSSGNPGEEAPSAG